MLLRDQVRRVLRVDPWIWQHTVNGDLERVFFEEVLGI